MEVNSSQNSVLPLKTCGVKQKFSFSLCLYTTNSEHSKTIVWEWKKSKKCWKVEEIARSHKNVVLIVEKHNFWKKREVWMERSQWVKNVDGITWKVEKLQNLSQNSNFNKKAKFKQNQNSFLSLEMITIQFVLKFALKWAIVSHIFIKFPMEENSVRNSNF